MELEDFEAHLAMVRAEREGGSFPEEFQRFDSWTASDAELSQAEHALRVQLPVKYKEFMRRYGGGEFLFLDLLPIVSPGGVEDDLLSINELEFRSKEFIAIAPVGTGDWWGFSVVDGVCREQVEFWDHEDGQVEFAATDILEFLVREGLRVGR